MPNEKPVRGVMRRVGWLQKLGKVFCFQVLGMEKTSRSRSQDRVSTGPHARASEPDAPDVLDRFRLQDVFLPVMKW